MRASTRAYPRPLLPVDVGDHAADELGGQHHLDAAVSLRMGVV